MKSRASIVDQIKNILERANVAKTGSVAESATAVAIAQKLMFQHKIEMYELCNEDEEVTEEFAVCNVIENNTTYKVAEWWTYLASAIAENNDCKAIHVLGSRNAAGRIEIIGYESGVAICKYMYKYLRKIIDDLCYIEYESHLLNGESPGNRKSWGMAFRLGAAIAIRERLYAQRVAQRAEYTGSTALARIDKSLERVQKHVDNLYPKLKRGKSIEIKNPAGYQEGRKVGKTIPLVDGRE